MLTCSSIEVFIDSEPHDESWSVKTSAVFQTNGKFLKVYRHGCYRDFALQILGFIFWVYPFFLQLQGRAQAANTAALTSVVKGKEVESEAITLHKKIESETVSFFNKYSNSKIRQSIDCLQSWVHWIFFCLDSLDKILNEKKRTFSTDQSSTRRHWPS